MTSGILSPAVRHAAIAEVIRLADLIAPTMTGTMRSGSLEWRILYESDDVQVLYCWAWNDDCEPMEMHENEESVEHFIVVAGRLDVYWSNNNMCQTLVANEKLTIPSGVAHCVVPHPGLILIVVNIPPEKAYAEMNTLPTTGG